MGGAPEGLTGTGTVEIKVLDINDNIPTLEKSEVSINVFMGYSLMNQTFLQQCHKLIELPKDLHLMCEFAALKCLMVVKMC